MDVGGATRVHFGGTTLVHRGRATALDVGRLGGSYPREEVLDGTARDGETPEYRTRREALRLPLVDGGTTDRVVILG